MNTNSGIYQILNTANGKYYIGSATILVGRGCRWDYHQRDLRANKHHNRHLQRAWNKYGEAAFKFVVLEYVSDPALLIEVEQYWIDFMDAADPNFGYNLHANAASSKGYKHSDQARANMSKSHQGQKPWNTGRKMTAEHRAILSKSHLGYKPSEEQRRKQSEGVKRYWANKKAEATV